MQNAHGLNSFFGNRHFSNDEVISNFREFDIQMADHRIHRHILKPFEAYFVFPDHRRLKG